MTRLATLFCLLASPLAAGGLVDEATAPDPCPDVPLVQPVGMADAMFAQWVAIRSMTCGAAPVAPRAFFDRATGERLTDEEITRRIFNGSTPIAPVPLPAGAWLLLGALAMLWRRR